jgi:hypothetical protein
VYVPNTWNHEQHKGRGGNHPRNITGLDWLAMMLFGGMVVVVVVVAYIVEDVQISG